MFVNRHENSELIIFSVVGKADYREYKIKELGPARVFHVREGSSWAIAIVREWGDGGSIDIQSDYGSFNYIWYLVGDSFYDFLRSLDFDYFMGKTRPDYKVFDYDASIKAIKVSLIENRKQGNLTRQQAREFWNDVENMGHCSTTAEFYDCIAQVAHIEEIYYDWDFPMYDKPSYQTKLFWNGPWQALCEHWKREQQ